MTCANTGLTSSGNQRELLTNSLGSRFQCIQTNLDALIPRSASRTCLTETSTHSAQMAGCIVDSVGAEKKLGVRLRYFTSISLLHCTMVPEKRLSTANLVSMCMFMGSIRRPPTPIERRTFWRTWVPLTVSVKLRRCGGLAKMFSPDRIRLDHWNRCMFHLHSFRYVP